MRGTGAGGPHVVKNLARHFPLPFTAQHHAYTPGEEDEHGNTVPGHLPPAPVACIWWAPSSDEPRTGQVNTERATADLMLAVDSALQVDPRDYFTFAEYTQSDPDDPAGRVSVRFDVDGFPKDYDHWPWGFKPGRRIVELKAVNG